MTQRTRHHYVPRVTQKYFTDDPNKTLIWRFDKTKKIMEEISIKDNAVVKQLYSYKNDNGINVTEVEDKFFFEIDGTYNKLIGMIEKRTPIEDMSELIINIFSTSYSRVHKQINNMTIL